MARRVFFSFHYDRDCWRASQVRNIGAIEGNRPATGNDWEQVKRGGDAAIKRWIDDQLDGRSCTIVLIGQETASREWVQYEISRSWNLKKGMFGIYVHNLKDNQQPPQQCPKGDNPFRHVTFKDTGKGLDTVVKAYDPPYYDSQQVYAYIAENMSQWVEAAVQQRA